MVLPLQHHIIDKLFVNNKQVVREYKIQKIRY